MNMDSETPQTNGDKAWQKTMPPQNELPFDHRSCTSRDLTFDFAKSAFRSAGIKWTDQNLDRLHLFDTQQQATNTALLLSDQCPYLIKCAVFKGDTKSKLTRRQNLSGSLLAQINAIMTFLNACIPEAIWPETALRESVINAVLHRDYDKNGPILVSVFASNIEIISPGGLVDDFEVNDLLNGVSEPRNAWLADVFEALNLCENYGTGVQRILDSYSQSLASPQLRVGPGSVAMILPRPVSESFWPDPRIDDETTQDTFDESSSNDFPTDSGKAKRYAFPSGGHLFTTVPSEALTGSRVLSAASLPSLIFAGAKAYQTAESRPMPLSHDRSASIPPNQDPSSSDDSQSAHLQIESIDEMTMALIAEQGKPLSRKQIQSNLGTDAGQTSYVLKKLVKQGRLRQIGHSKTAKYSLS
ncbi:putative HTH transcriptional regulator [Bifidobacterium commune]|uniref:Putative ATP-dependent DNA helicase recG C-terminal n=1 Tax=Bifidobacterium commune TaxID=1505727 RepID=A0A1C4H0M4_9BIFI|nr:ATP-binding protein [Bifidobacterium commune]MBB2954636.1 putative HTH transcriptional regulator [Bifidobacterium commune]SCC78451.1 Putative ATP-dependent DNA helicase recG C-terminal [Bifidobacterium commune]